MGEHLVFYVGALVSSGVVAGYAAGLFGIGGGVILVPTFLALFPHLGASHSVVMHCAVGTCLALVVPSAITATRKQRVLGNIETHTVRTWLPWVALGTLVGVTTIELLQTHDLKMIFTVYLFASAAYVAARRAEESGPPGHPPTMAKVLGGLVIGDLSVWLGLGGGTFTVPYFRAFRYPIKKAIAVSSATGLIIGAGGAIGAILHGWEVQGRTPYSFGYVDGLAFVIIAPIVMVVAPLGSKTASRMPETTLKWIYVALLVGIAAYMAMQTF